MEGILVLCIMKISTFMKDEFYMFSKKKLWCKLTNLDLIFNNFVSGIYLYFKIYIFFIDQYKIKWEIFDLRIINIYSWIFFRWFLEMVYSLFCLDFSHMVLKRQVNKWILCTSFHFSSNVHFLNINLMLNNFYSNGRCWK